MSARDFEPDHEPAELAEVDLAGDDDGWRPQAPAWVWGRLASFGRERSVWIVLLALWTFADWRAKGPTRVHALRSRTLAHRIARLLGHDDPAAIELQVIRNALRSLALLGYLESHGPASATLAWRPAHAAEPRPRSGKRGRKPKARPVAPAPAEVEALEVDLAAQPTAPTPEPAPAPEPAEVVPPRVRSPRKRAPARPPRAPEPEPEPARPSSAAPLDSLGSWSHEPGAEVAALALPGIEPVLAEVETPAQARAREIERHVSEVLAAQDAAIQDACRARRKRVKRLPPEGTAARAKIAAMVRALLLQGHTREELDHVVAVVRADWRQYDDPALDKGWILETPWRSNNFARLLAKEPAGEKIDQRNPDQWAKDAQARLEAAGLWKPLVIVTPEPMPTVDPEDIPI